MNNWWQDMKVQETRRLDLLSAKNKDRLARVAVRMSDTETGQQLVGLFAMGGIVGIVIKALADTGR